MRSTRALPIRGDVLATTKGVCTASTGQLIETNMNGRE
jgi:hypothetical protein